MTRKDDIPPGPSGHLLTNLSAPPIRTPGSTRPPINVTPDPAAVANFMAYMRNNRPLEKAEKPTSSVAEPVSAPPAEPTPEPIIHEPDMTMSELNRLHDLYMAGEPANELAKEAHLNGPSELYRLFKQHNLPVRSAIGWEFSQKDKTGKTELSADEIRALHHRYLSGDTVATLSLEIGISAGNLYHYFNRLGLPLLGKRSKPKVDSSTLASLHQRYLDGEPAGRLAGEVGLSNHQLYAQFRLNNLPTKWELAEAEAIIEPTQPVAVKEPTEAETTTPPPVLVSEPDTAIPPAPRPGRQKRRSLQNVFVQSLYQRYLDGETVEDLATKTGVDKMQIYAEFKARDLPLKIKRVTKMPHPSPKTQPTPKKQAKQPKQKGDAQPPKQTTSPNNAALLPLEFRFDQISMGIMTQKFSQIDALKIALEELGLKVSFTAEVKLEVSRE